MRTSLAQGEKLGISGTPAVVLGINQNGKIEAASLIVGSQPYALFKDELDKLIAGNSPKP